MQEKDEGRRGRSARPILVERDYEAAKRSLQDHVTNLKPFLEAGRLEALIRVLSDYERQPGLRARRVGLSAGSRPAREEHPRRRWTDSSRSELSIQHAPGSPR